MNSNLNAVVNEDELTEVEQWEQDLDATWLTSTTEELEAHLSKAPEGAPSAEALRMYMEGRRSGENKAA